MFRGPSNKRGIVAKTRICSMFYHRAEPLGGKLKRDVQKILVLYVY